MTAPAVRQYEQVNADSSLTEFVEVKTNQGATVCLSFQCADASSAAILFNALSSAVDVQEISLL